MTAGKMLLKFELLLVFIFMLESSLANLHSISLGFLSAIEQNRPFALLLTATGLQLLTQTQKCYDNQNSMYYPSETVIKFIDYSTVDNYLIWVDQLDRVCVRNLFKNSWNTLYQNYHGLPKPSSGACKSITRDAKFVALGAGRRILYIIDKNGDLYISAFLDPKCSNVLYRKLYADANCLHATNFEKGTDLVLIGTGEGMQVFTADLEYIKFLELNGSVSHIASDANNQVFFAIYSASGGQTKVYRVQCKGREFFGSPQLEFTPPRTSSIKSISASRNWIAYHLHDMHNQSNWIVFNQIGTNQSVEYRCGNASDLFAVVLVEERKQRDSYICDTNPMLCGKFGGNAGICNPKEMLKFKKQVVIDENQMETELWNKIVLTMMFAVLAGMVWTLALLQHYIEQPAKLN